MGYYTIGVLEEKKAGIQQINIITNWEEFIMSNRDDQSQNINSKDFLIGSLIGGIVGASMALLFAPKSGKELRGDLNQGASYVRDRASEWKDVAYEKGSEWKDYAMETSTQLGQTFSEKSQDIGSRVKDATKNFQDKVTSENSDPEKAAEEVAQAIEKAAEEFENQNKI